MAVVPEENHPSHKGYGANCSEEREVAPCRPEGTGIQKGFFFFQCVGLGLPPDLHGSLPWGTVVCTPAKCGED